MSQALHRQAGCADHNMHTQPCSLLSPHLCESIGRLQRSRQRVSSRRVICRANGPGALILEADGVIADVHMDGHRVAFNKAFHDLGFDCANWTPAIYHDLLSQGDGTGEGLVTAYYSTVGWPTFLPTVEQTLFATKVHQLKQKQLKKMLQKAELPLRDGIAQVMSEAVAAGVVIAVIAGTASEPEDDVISCITAQLPPDVAAAVRVYSTTTYSKPEEEQGEVQPAALGENEISSTASSSSSSLESSIAAATTRLKQQGAQEFVQRMATALQGKQAGVPVGLDLALQNPGTPKTTSAAWLAAVAATLGVPASSCITVASSSDLINAAVAAGMLPVAVPRKMAYAASYPAAAAKFEAFGPGYATWQKLVGVWQRQQQQQ